MRYLIEIIGLKTFCFFRTMYILYIIYVYCCFHDVKEFNKCLVYSHDNC